MAKWVQEVYQAQQGLLVEEEGEVSEVHLDLLDLWENQVHLVEEACLETTALQVPKVKVETEDLLDHLALKASKETWVELVHLVCKV